MAKKSIESLYDVLFNMRKMMEDVVQNATGLVNDVNDYGGELSRVVKEQMQKYFIPAVQNLTKDENTPGSIIGVIRFMDSLPLAMTRVEPQVEQVAPIEQPNANIDMPVATEEAIPLNTSYENPVPGAAPEAPATPVAPEQPMMEAKQKADVCFGTAMARKQEVLNKITNKEDLIAFVKDVCKPSDAEQEEYLKGMVDTISRNSFTRALQYLYNIILKGQGLGTISPKKKYKEAITKYAIVRSSYKECSIGEDVANLEDQEVAEFNEKEEADARCELLNKGVLPEEKELFGTEYKVVEKETPCENC